VGKLNQGYVEELINNPDYAEAVRARSTAARPAEGEDINAGPASSRPVVDSAGRVIPLRINQRRNLSFEDMSVLRERVRTKAGKIKAHLAK
jgi:hypothetical protein